MFFSPAFECIIEKAMRQIKDKLPSNNEVGIQHTTGNITSKLRRQFLNSEEHNNDSIINSENFMGLQKDYNLNANNDFYCSIKTSS